MVHLVCECSLYKKIYLSPITKQIVNSAFIDVMTLAAALIHSIASVAYAAVATFKILTCTVAADGKAESTLVDIYGERDFSRKVYRLITVLSNKKNKI